MFTKDQTELERVGLQIIFILLLISSIGLLMVYSSSYIYAKEVYGSSVYFFLKQLIYFAIGLAVAIIVSKTKFSFWIKYGLHINTICTVLLILTMVPSFSRSVKGASRWIEFNGLGMQPSEIVKFSLMILAIPWLVLSPERG